MKKLIFLTITTIFLFACPLSNQYINDGCDQPFYRFNNPVIFTPSDSTIHIGDTIMVSSFIPMEKWDRDSNSIFILDSIDFHMGGGIIKLDTLTEKGQYYNSMDDFEWMVDSIYNFRSRRISYAFDYYYSNEGYDFQCIIIPKQKGIYLFTMNSLIGVVYSVKAEEIYTANNKCHTNKWYPRFQTNAGNNFKELLPQSPNNHYSGTYYNKWARYNNIYGAHCFKVE